MVFSACYFSALRLIDCHHENAMALFFWWRIIMLGWPGYAVKWQLFSVVVLAKVYQDIRQPMLEPGYIG
jgi:hypothetical protein